MALQADKLGLLRSLATPPVAGTPAGTGVSAKEFGGGGLPHKTILTLRSVVIATVDAGAAGAQGSQKVYDFPEGAIQFLGATMNLTTLAGAGGIADTGALVGSVGSVAAGAGDAALTSTEANIIPSTAGTLVAGAGVLKGISAAPIAPVDGTTTPVDAILNIAVPDAGSSADDTVTISGTITITWSNAGDF